MNREVLLISVVTFRMLWWRRADLQWNWEARLRVSALTFRYQEYQMVK